MMRRGVALLVALVLAGCEGAARAEAERSVLVLAASDLQHALPVIAREYGAATGQRVELVLGSTGNLTAQIEQGAPGDLFLAANERFVDRLEAAGLTREGSRRVYAVGRIALVSAPGGRRIGGLEELAEPRVTTVAIANPEHAPYGQAAREALVGAGVWAAVEPKLVYGENVSQAYQFVGTGNADAGIVAVGILRGVPSAPYVLVDAALHAPLRQAGVVLKDAPNGDAAADLLAFVAGARGQEILASYGFESPGP
jgi:molybdate transport system substrate-binding protein